MAAVAAMMKEMGYDVSGSDQDVYPPMSTFLYERDIPVYSGFDPVHLEPAPDVVVVGNAISRGNTELEEILTRRIPMMSLPDSIREFLIRDRQSIVVTGTHGKTTTASLLAWIFSCARRDPSFLIGGIMQNIGRGFQLGAGKEVIVEGDEYDSAYFDKVAKFLRYRPDIGVINHVEFDHADIYNSLDEIKTAFRRFVNLIPANGMLAACSDFDTVNEVIVNAYCPVSTFGIRDPHAHWQARGMKIHPDGMQFDVYFHGDRKGEISTLLTGQHNIRNILAAIAVSAHKGIEFDTIQKAIHSFRGIKRRLELKGTANGISVYDDFGHHPTAVKETLTALKARYPGKRIWALFEPRSATTRRNIFQKELVHALSLADRVLLAPIHRPDKAPAEDVLSLETLSADLKARLQKASLA